MRADREASTTTGGKESANIAILDRCKRLRTPQSAVRGLNS